MKPPICKLCGKAHWAYEGHQLADTAVPGYVREMAAGAMGYEKVIATFPDENPPESATTVASTVPTVSLQDVPTPEGVPTCECGKPREGRYKQCAACRKRAYRERSRG